MARLVPVSSTKTRVAGARSATAARQAVRSSSSRSLAKRTFFDREPEAAHDARHGGDADADPTLLRPRVAVLGQRGIGRGIDLGGQRRGVLRSNAGRAAGPPFRRQIPGTRLLPSPPGNGAQTDAKGAGRLGVAVPSAQKAQQPLAEDGGVLFHPRSVPCRQLICNPL